MKNLPNFYFRVLDNVGIARCLPRTRPLVRFRPTTSYLLWTCFSHTALSRPSISTGTHFPSCFQILLPLPLQDIGLI